jgi:Mg2+/Co2+ transporter CorC
VLTLYVQIIQTFSKDPKKRKELLNELFTAENSQTDAATTKILEDALKEAGVAIE